MFRIRSTPNCESWIHPWSLSLSANLFYWQNESTPSLTPHFLEENEILQFVSFHYLHNQNTSELLIINHSLKYKVVTSAEFLKHTCERVNFRKVRSLQPATLVKISTFTGSFQGFCLTWMNSYLTSTSQWLFLTKHK